MRGAVGSLRSTAAGRWALAALVLMPSIATAHRTSHRASHLASHRVLRVNRFRPSALVVRPPPALNAGALELGRPFDTGPAPRLTASFYQEHAALVRHDMLFFHPESVGANPARLYSQQEPSKELTMSFISLAPTDSLLEIYRDRDRLLLFRERSRGNEASSLGMWVGMFTAATLLAAHAPEPFRVLFDGPVHFGPAIFQTGGLGVGIGGDLPQ